MMICVIGGKCSDGVALIADRRVISSPNSVEALQNIQSGRTKMITQGTDETLAELKELENEP